MATLTTDTSGGYSAPGLTNTTYTVRVTDTGSVLTGYFPTYERTGGASGPFDYQESVNLLAGNVTNVNFGYARPRPTYAAVAYLTAYVSEGSVIVEWRTSLEVGTAGFHVLRLDPADGAYTRVDERLVPGLVVQPRGGTYRLRDEGAPPEGTVTYKLVEVDVRGKEREYGPYTVRLGPPRTAAGDTQLRAAMARADHSGQPFDRQPPRVPGLRPETARALLAERAAAAIARRARRGPSVKVSTRGEGLTYVPADQVASIVGRPPSTVAGLIRAGPSVAHSPRAGRAVPAGRRRGRALLLRRARRQRLHARQRLPAGGGARPAHGERALRGGRRGLGLVPRDRPSRGGPVSAPDLLPGPRGRLLDLGLPLRGLRRVRHQGGHPHRHRPLPRRGGGRC